MPSTGRGDLIDREELADYDTGVARHESSG
jgi:hypothetical protein